MMKVNTSWFDWLYLELTKAALGFVILLLLAAIGFFAYVIMKMSVSGTETITVIVLIGSLSYAIGRFFFNRLVRT